MGSICGKSKTRVTDDQIQREAEEQAIAVSLGSYNRESDSTSGQGQLASELRRSWMLSIGLDPDRIEDMPRTYGTITAPVGCHQSARADNEFESLIYGQAFKGHGLRDQG